MESNAVPYLDRLGGDKSDYNRSYSEKFSSYDDWQADPESIPKGENYYEHDNRDRDDMTYWERRQLFQSTGHRFPRARGTGTFRGRPTFRTRGFVPRGRGGGFTRGIGRGYPRYNYQGGNPSYRGRNTTYRGSFDRRYSTDEWKHDKYADLENEGASDIDEDARQDKDFDESETHKISKSKSGDLKRKSDGNINGKDKKVKKDKKHKDKKEKKNKEKSSSKKHEKESSDDWVKPGNKGKSNHRNEHPSSEPGSFLEGKQSDDLAIRLESKEEVSVS